jgi:predicted ribosomally synthesized peptide with SipW-like signal peptide
MKQILISLSIIGVVGALVIGGTVAHFYDEERIRVQFEAGTLDLTVGGGNVAIAQNIDNIAPGASGSRYVRLKNIGTLKMETDKIIRNL